MASSGDFPEVWGQEVQRSRAYRLVVAVLAVALVVQSMALWLVARRPYPPPVVVRTDAVGRAEVVDYIPEDIDPAGPEVSYFLNQFIVGQYGRRRAVVQQRWEDSLWFTSAEVSAQLEDEYGEGVSEFIAGATGPVEVFVENVRIRVLPNPEAPHAAQVSFDRLERVGGRVLQEEPWSVNLQFGYTPVTAELEMRNPIGLVITFLEDSVVRTGAGAESGG